MNHHNDTPSATSERPVRRRRSKIQIFAAVLFASVFALSACASDSDDGTTDDTDTGTEEARQIEVGATSFEFDPSEITIAAGEEVVISLTSDDIEHDFVVDEASFELTAPVGETAEGTLQIDEAGTYTYYCSIAGHREAGMEGTLTVE